MFFLQLLWNSPCVFSAATMEQPLCFFCSYYGTAPVFFLESRVLFCFHCSCPVQCTDQISKHRSAASCLLLMIIMIMTISTRTLTHCKWPSKKFRQNFDDLLIYIKHPGPTPNCIMHHNGFKSCLVRFILFFMMGRLALSDLTSSRN